jgi:hypothetical protein
MAPLERQFLKVAGAELARVKVGGAFALAGLLDIVASWNACRLDVSFTDYAKGWVQEGNAKSTAAHRLLCDLFGIKECA